MNWKNILKLHIVHIKFWYGFNVPVPEICEVQLLMAFLVLADRKGKQLFINLIIPILNNYKAYRYSIKVEIFKLYPKNSPGHKERSQRTHYHIWYLSYCVIPKFELLDEYIFFCITQKEPELYWKNKCKIIASKTCFAYFLNYLQDSLSSWDKI